MNRRNFLACLATTALGVHVARARAANTSFLAAIHCLLVRKTVQKYFREQFGVSLETIYWGDLHNHTAFSSDAQVSCGVGVSLSPGAALDYARNIADLDFIAITDHAEMRNDIPGVADNWKRFQAIINEKNDEKCFIVFPGWEYTNTVGLEPNAGSATGYGHKNVLFRDLNDLPQKMIGAFDRINSNDIVVAPTCTELWNRLTPYLSSSESDPSTALTVIHTPAMNGNGVAAHNHQTDFTFMHNRFARHLEIYSKWGNSEGPAPLENGCCEGDTLVDYEADNQEADKTIRRLLFQKWVIENNADFILGFTGSTDNHMGQPANSTLNQCGFPYRGGVTGIVSPEYGRKQLWQNLYDRHTLAATDDCRTGLLFAVQSGGNHLFMGDTGIHQEEIRIRVLTEPDVTRIEILLDGDLLDIVTGYEVDATCQLSAGNHYLYVKAVTERDGSPTRVTWSSPVYLRAQES